ncbi:ArsR family transcriptional regulator [Kitasatospora nipponensis]|uniref:ArsR family transcriptional regulator n=1 Tax=Kitasatospora nipponensis TaxID=258049 RepID=A0ABP4GH38_9ACTN
MIRIELTADATARTRFAVSPVYQAVGLLFELGRRPQLVPRALRLRSREVIQDRGLWLLAALTVSPHGYTPDFLTPEPTAYSSPVDDELHRVASVAAERVRDEMAVVSHGLDVSRVPARGAQRVVLEALGAGEDRFAQLLAGQLDAFWRGVLAPSWGEISERLERDVDQRAGATARLGLGGMIGGLDPLLDWQDGALAVNSEYHVDYQAPGIILIPGAFLTSPTFSIDTTYTDTPRTPVITYPTAARPEGPHDLGELIGGSRAAILKALSKPRTTAEVARHVHLSASTVSYHLQVLHRAGLLQRVQRSRHVFYQVRAAGQSPLRS